MGNTFMSAAAKSRRQQTSIERAKGTATEAEGVVTINVRIPRALHRAGAAPPHRDGREHDAAHQPPHDRRAWLGASDERRDTRRVVYGRILRTPVCPHPARLLRSERHVMSAGWGNTRKAARRGGRRVRCRNNGGRRLLLLPAHRGRTA